MHGLQIEWELYGVPVLLCCAMVFLVIVANVAAERAFKSHPDLRRPTYAFLNAIGLAFLITIALAFFIGPRHASWCFPLLFILMLMTQRKSKQDSSM
jgi:L-asparagine transporter-like permease